MKIVREFVFLSVILSLGCGGTGRTNLIGTANPSPSPTNTAANPAPPNTNAPPASPTSTNTNANSNPVTMKVTSCSGVASCQFAFSQNGQRSTAITSAFVGGYVGDPNLPFSGGSVAFQLAGESTPTYLGNLYSGTGVYAGSDPNYGSLYQVSGSFSGTDAATNRVVSGSISVLVGIKGHSGRGGGNQYLAVNGSMTIN